MRRRLGISVRRPAERTLAIVKRYVDDVITVSDQAIARAIVVLLERTKMLAEGAGAAGIAAVLEANGRVGGQRVGVVVSGGNIDPNLLGKALQQGLASAGRRRAFGLSVRALLSASLSSGFVDRNETRRYDRLSWQ